MWFIIGFICGALLLIVWHNIRKGQKELEEGEEEDDDDDDLSGQGGRQAFST